MLTLQHIMQLRKKEKKGVVKVVGRHQSHIVQLMLVRLALFSEVDLLCDSRMRSQKTFFREIANF